MARTMRNEGRIPQDTLEIARTAIGALLEGAPPISSSPDQMGPYAECYSEMERAYDDGGTDAARRVFRIYAEKDATIAALRAAGPDMQYTIYANGNGPPTSLPTIGTSMGSEVRERNAAELRTEWAAGGRAKLDYLPFLGREQYIVRGWSHLLAGYPKVGKTELITHLCLEWPDEQILYFTEEPESVWGTRLQGVERDCNHLTIVIALGLEPQAILARIQQGRETVVVIDTARNLLNLHDERDNSEIARVLNPYIAACRMANKTFIVTHHIRKGGGEHGEGITGGHAFLGVVDRALELAPVDGNQENRRRVRGWGRIFVTPDLLYERRDGEFVALGNPGEIALQDVKLRVLESLSDIWQTKKEIRDGLDKPEPSNEQIRLALEELRQEGKVERDPQEGGQGRTHRFRKSLTLLPMDVPIMGSEVGDEDAEDV